MWNKISIDFNLQQERDWMNDGTNDGHTITRWSISQQPTEKDTEQRTWKQCYMYNKGLGVHSIPTVFDLTTTWYIIWLDVGHYTTNTITFRLSWWYSYIWKWFENGRCVIPYNEWGNESRSHKNFQKTSWTIIWRCKQISL